MARQRLLPLLLALFLLAVATGCADTSTPDNEPTPAADTPVADTPAADTPAADTPAADTPAADTPAADANTPIPADTPTISPDTIAPIAIDELIDYTHPESIFSLQIPQGWSAQEIGDVQATVVSFEEPERRAAVLVMVIDSSEVDPDVSLADQLGGFVDSIFRGLPDYQVENLTAETPTEARMDFVFGTLTLDDVLLPSRGQAFGWREGNLTTFLVQAVPRVQFLALEDTLTTIAQSYTLNAAAAALVPDPPSPTPTIDPRPVGVDDLPTFPAAEPLDDDTLRQQLATRFAEQFERAESELVLATVPLTTSFDTVGQFYDTALTDWVPDQLSEGLFDEPDTRVAVWTRNAQVFILLGITDVFNDRLVLVQALLTEAIPQPTIAPASTPTGTAVPE